MGIYLSRPLTSKDNDVKESEIIAACSTDMQGWRVYMEDAHIMYLDDSNETSEFALFGVFDGHGGPAVSRWVSMNFMKSFKQKLRALEDNLESEDVHKRYPIDQLPVTRVAALAQALEGTFLEVDDLLRQKTPEFEQDLRVIQNAAMRVRKREMALEGIEEPTSQSFFKDLIDGRRWRVSDSDKGDKQEASPIADKDLSFLDIFEDELKKDEQLKDSQRDRVLGGPGIEFNITHDFQEKRLPYDPQSCGCTAVVAGLMIKPIPCLVVANAGDSRCVLSRNGKAVKMTVDHKPLQEREMQRIRAAGGTVSNGRVDSNLNLSRSLGDLHYKNEYLAPIDQKISPVPDLTFIPLCNEDDFIILACDGIWDILTEEECVEKVRAGWDQLKELHPDAADSDLCRQIAEELCDHCLAPTPFDPESAGAGCDNMTAMVIRVKDKWRNEFPALADMKTSDRLPKLYGNDAEQANYLMIDIRVN